VGLNLFKRLGSGLWRKAGWPLFVLVVVAFCVGGQERAPASLQDSRVETLTKRASEARAAGKTEVSFSLSVASIPEFSTGIRDALSEYTALIGTPTARQVVTENNQSLSTWYSINVVEMLNTRVPAIYDFLRLTSLPQSLKPTALLPFPDHHVLLLAAGGSVVIDGVKVTQREGGEESLQAGKQYLFVADCSAERLARLPFGAVGIFLVQDDGDHLLPLSGSRHPLTTDVTSGGFNSISRIRDLLSERRQ
jgi:hypothetical protein